MRHRDTNHPLFGATADRHGKQRQFSAAGQQRDSYRPVALDDQLSFLIAITWLMVKYIDLRDDFMDVFGTEYLAQADLVLKWVVHKSTVSRRCRRLLAKLRRRGQRDEVFLALLPDRFKPYVLGRDRRQSHAGDNWDATQRD